MSETTALRKNDEAPGPLVDADWETNDLFDHRGDNPELRFFAKAGLVLALGIAFSSFITSAPVPVIVGIGFATVVVLFQWSRWRTARTLRRAMEVNRLSELGQLDEAVAKQLALVKSTHDRFLRTTTALDLGNCELHRGNTDRALELLSAGYRKTKHKRLLPIVGRNLAMAYLARGDVDAAAAWVPEDTGSLLYVPEATAAVHARRGEWDDLLALEWPEREGLLEKVVRHERRLFFLLRAYARERRGNPDLSIIADELEAARPAYTGEYDYLTAQWPELRAFVADRCLPPRSAPDAEGLPAARVVEKR